MQWTVVEAAQEIDGEMKENKRQKLCEYDGRALSNGMRFAMLLK